MTYDNLQLVTSGFEEKARRIGSGQAWIFKAKSSQRNEYRSLLTKLDRIVGGMPDIERDKLTKRFSDIIPVSAQQFKEEYDNQFLDALVEVLGWGWLHDKYPSCKVQFSEPPDLVVQDDAGKAIAAMACKKIRISDEDRTYFEKHQAKTKPVKDSITSPDCTENPFLGKVMDTLRKAEEQLGEVETSDKFIFIDFSWDMSALIQKPQVEDLTKRLAAGLQGRSIKLIAFEYYQVDKPFIDA